MSEQIEEVYPRPKPKSDCEAAAPDKVDIHLEFHGTVHINKVIINNAACCCEDDKGRGPRSDDADSDQG